MNDPYRVLGVDKTASDKEVRNAYRRLAKQYHPDHNPDNTQAEERFKAIGQAYNILGDKEKRARYDRGEIDAEGQERAPFGAGGFGQGGGGFGGAQGFASEDLSSFFSDMFGGGFSGDFRPGGTAGQRAAKGSDRRYEVAITFVQAVLGTTLQLALGDGAHTEVRVPPGVESGQTLRVRGKGAPGRPGRDGHPGLPGDALIALFITPDKRFTREERDIRLTHPIPLRTAVLGGKTTVPTPGGPVTVTIPRHSDSGRVLRLGGRGVAVSAKGKAGDLLVTLQVQIGTVSPELEAFLASQEEGART